MKYKHRVFCHYKYKYGYWFRVFGLGLRIEDRRYIEARFGERNGFQKVLRIKYLAILLIYP